MKKVIVIGSGFSSLSAASYLAKEGLEVSIFEKNDIQREVQIRRKSDLSETIGIDSGASE